MLLHIYVPIHSTYLYIYIYLRDISIIKFIIKISSTYKVLKSRNIFCLYYIYFHIQEFVDSVGDGFQSSHLRALHYYIIIFGTQRGMSLKSVCNLLFLCNREFIMIFFFLVQSASESRIYRYNCCKSLVYGSLCVTKCV